MTRAVAVVAFLFSLLAFLVVAGFGLMLLVVQSSGERGAGALLVVCALLALAAALMLVFARPGAFAGGVRKAAAAGAAVLAALPVAAIAWTTLRFAGLPIGSAMPLVDWPIFAAGIVLALGALSIFALGYLRMNEDDAGFSESAPGEGRETGRMAAGPAASVTVAPTRLPPEPTPIPAPTPPPRRPVVSRSAGPARASLDDEPRVTQVSPARERLIAAFADRERISPDELREGGFFDERESESDPDEPIELPSFNNLRRR